MQVKNLLQFLVDFFTIILMMKKVKTFIHVLTQSLSFSDHYYKKILKTKFSFSLKYLAMLLFIFNAVFVLILVMKNLPILINLGTIRTSLSQSLNSYPEDLVIAIRSKRLTTNFGRPYIMWLTYKDVPSPLFVVDEKADFSQINQYNTFFLVNNKGIATTYGKRTNLNVYEFKQKDDSMINKQAINLFKKKVLGFFDLLPFLTVMIVALALSIPTAIALVAKLFYLGIISLLVFFVFKLLTKKSTYKKTLQLSLHSSTLLIFLEYFLTLFGIRVRSSLWLLPFLIIFLVIALYQVYIHQQPSLKAKGAKH